LHSNGFIIIASVLFAANFPHLNFAGIAIFDCAMLPRCGFDFQFVYFLLLQAMFTSKPPRVVMPLTEPSGHASGRAGRGWMQPAWL
jgi:hypothetical protein